MSKGIEKQHVEIEDLRKAAGGDAPTPAPDVTLEGANFFSGPHRARRLGGFGNISMTDTNWRQMWRSLGHTAPGPLPEGAVAVMNVEDRADDPVDMLPEKITRDGREIEVSWNRYHTAVEGEKPVVSRFAVLLLPRGKLSQVFRDTYRRDEIAREKERAAQRDAERAVITGGLNKPVPVMPKIKVTPKKPTPPGR